MSSQFFPVRVEWIKPGDPRWVEAQIQIADQRALDDGLLVWRVTNSERFSATLHAWVVERSVDEEE